MYIRACLPRLKGLTAFLSFPPPLGHNRRTIHPPLCAGNRRWFRFQLVSPAASSTLDKHPRCTSSVHTAPRRKTFPGSSYVGTEGTERKLRCWVFPTHLSRWECNVGLRVFFYDSHLRVSRPGTKEFVDCFQPVPRIIRFCGKPRKMGEPSTCVTLMIIITGGVCCFP